MTPGDFAYVLGQLNDPTRQGATFTLPYRIVRMMTTIAQRAGVQLPGQPNLNFQVPLPTQDATVAYLDLLTQPTNGHKLLVPTPYRNLLVSVLKRTALDLNGHLLNT